MKCSNLASFVRLLLFKIDLLEGRLTQIAVLRGTAVITGLLLHLGKVVLERCLVVDVVDAHAHLCVLCDGKDGLFRALYQVIYNDICKGNWVVHVHVVVSIWHNMVRAPFIREFLTDNVNAINAIIFIYTSSPIFLSVGKTEWNRKIWVH